MTFEQLEYFIAVAETDTFYTAADILHITQSALSKQIMKLEQELDLELFDRSHRNAVLSPAGKVFYHEAVALVLQYRKALNKMEHIKSPTGQALAIGTLPILDMLKFRDTLHKFMEVQSDIRITLDEVEEQELLFGLDSDVYDFIIARDNMIDTAKFEITPIADDPLLAVFAVGRYSNQYVTLSRLAENSISLMNSYTATYKACIRLFQKDGIEPDILRAARVNKILETVASGDAVSLLPASTIPASMKPKITTVPLSPKVSFKLAIGIRRDSPERELAEELKKQLLK